MKYLISYNGFLQKIDRTFKTKKRAIQWLRQIGKTELISNIKKIVN